VTDFGVLLATADQANMIHSPLEKTENLEARILSLFPFVVLQVRNVMRTMLSKCFEEHPLNARWVQPCQRRNQALQKGLNRVAILDMVAAGYHTIKDVLQSA